VAVADKSNLVKAIENVVAKHGEGKTDWIGAMAYDDSFSLWSLPILMDVLEWLRPYFVLLVREDRIVVNKLSFRDKILESRSVSKSDLKDFTFKKGIFSSKVKMTLPDGKKYKLQFPPTKLMLGYAKTQAKALEILESFQT
jgi:hypothetical protein